MRVVCFSLFIVYNNYKIIARRNKRLRRTSSPRDVQLQDLFIFLFFYFFFSHISGYFVSGWHTGTKRCGESKRSAENSSFLSRFVLNA